MSAVRALVGPLLAGLAVAAIVFVAMDAGGGGAQTATAPPAHPVIAGEAVYVRMGCGSCHRLAAAGSRGDIGPNLDERLPTYTRAALRSQIVNPYGGGDSLGTMPSGFGERMSRKELDALVDFLLASRRR